VPRSDLVFGKYRLLRPLDDIDSGEAYLATLVGIEGFEKRVVIWRISGALARAANLIDAVIFEAKRAASLSHSSLAQVLDLGVVEGTCVVVTEHVPGHSLGAVLRGASQLPWHVAAHLAGEVAEGLSYAHGRRASNGDLLRLVHRRLSPGRIALTAAGDVKLTGFGMSWAWTALDEYRSPEEARGEPIDGRADVFALGAVLRNCVPHTGVPDALRALIDWAMQPYPEQRPTAGELRQALAGVLHTADRSVTPRDLAAVAPATATGPTPGACQPDRRQP